MATKTKKVGRSRYRNGDEINLPGGCNNCSPAMINGVLCHETGCPDAWRDYPKECYECGANFYSSNPHVHTCHRH